MTDKDARIAQLENVIAQMMRPLRGIPFDLVIKVLAGRKILSFDAADPADRRLLSDIGKVLTHVADAVRKNPIERPRPNEVGNDIEPFVARAFKGVGYETSTPTGISGKKKSAGYPDMLVQGSGCAPVYIECKTFSSANADTSFRAFYLSPSDDFKVTVDAKHLLVAFEMEVVGQNGPNNLYVPRRAKVISLESLACDVKYEFYASNNALYQQTKLLLDVDLG